MTDKKEYLKKSIDFIKQPKVSNLIIITLFIVVLVLSTSIRLQNLPLLIDQTTGEYIPLALDPFYFLRVSETIMENGFVPDVDSMRYPSLNLPFTKELTPIATIVIYKVINTFTPISLQFANVISPIIFFVLGLITFFLLVLVITSSKYIALLSSAFLAFVPPYLYRTMAGFSDHESLGMFAFFLVLLIYVLILKYLESNKHIIKTILYTFILSILTIFAMLSWSGAFAFLIMIIPLSFLLIWLIKFKYINLRLMFHYSLFYVIWIVLTSSMGYLIGVNIIPRFLSSSGIISIFTLVFILIDYLISYLISKNYFDRINDINKYRILYSIGMTILIGIILLPLVGKSILTILMGIFNQLIKPFGTERVATTVAENVQPYLINYINQIGKYLFWLSFAGIILMGFKFGNKLSTTKGMKISIIIWIILIMSMLFSRLYPGSVLDGINIFSQFIYMGGILIFLFFGLRIYFNNDIEFDYNLIFIITLVLISILSLRSASRVFFLIVPFTCIYASYFTINISKYINHKDEILKGLCILLLILSIIGSISILYTSYNTINMQAKYTGPSANYQWQGAMNFVRLNTNIDDIFISWWDYGYWIQYLGQRPTITDGGHGNAYWDHLIGRYLLTNTNYITTMSFMKSHDVDYLLIDQTDFGKYPAYSKIGSDNSYDSFSILTIGVVDGKQTIETRDTIIRTYPFWGIVDEDIIYQTKDNQIFLSGPTYNEIGEPNYNSFLGAIIITNINGSFKQPEGIFMYNDNQFKIPIRYLYLNGQVIDFSIGLNSMIYLMPKIEQLPNGQISIDNLGAVTYLSEKVFKSLFAQLYLLNDVFNNYPTIKLAHSEDDILIKNLRIQGARINDIVYFNGFRGPIKIWKVEYSNDIKIVEEFTSLSGKYGELDYIE